MDKHAVPRLSPSIAKILLDKTPAHAYAAHRLLGGGLPKRRSWALDRGRDIDDAVFLGDKTGGDDILNAAQAALNCFALHDVRLDSPGVRTQRRLEWTSHGADCSGVPDLYFEADGGLVVDLKSAGDLGWTAIDYQCSRLHYDMQVAAYVDALGGGRPGVLLFVESGAPFCFRWVTLSAAAMERGMRKWRRACKIWADCMDSGTWPGYEDFELA